MLSWTCWVTNSGIYKVFLDPRGSSGIPGAVVSSKGSSIVWSIQSSSASETAMVDEKCNNELNDEPRGAPMIESRDTNARARDGAMPNKQKTGAMPPNRQKTGAMPTKKKGVDARFPFLGLVTVVTVSYFFEPMR